MCLCTFGSFQSVTLLSSIINLLCLRESFLHMFYVFTNRFLVFHFLVNICGLCFIKFKLQLSYTERVID